MREIGSEFWDVPTSEKDNGLFPESTQWFLSGRSALQAIIKELGAARSVSLPSWCCDSMIKPFVDAHYAISFYPVAVKGGLMQEFEMDADVLFLMDYFGYTGPQPDLSCYNGIVIRDVTHSIFSSSYSDADYCFGSFRKWCGVWTGGYAWASDGHRFGNWEKGGHEYIALRRKAMDEKTEYMEGNRADKDYLKAFNSAEECLENVGVFPAAERDVALAKLADVELIKSRRRANAEILRRAFSDWLVFPEVSNTDTPMFVPVLVPDGKRDVLRRFLIDNRIYCPVHWPVSQYHKLDERTEAIYRNELSLVCDQRYTENDMNRMADMIKAFWKEA